MENMEKVHVQKKKKNNKHKQMQNSQIFWVFKAIFFKFCLLLETSRFLSSSSSQALFPVNSKTSPSSLELCSISSSS